MAAIRPTPSSWSESPGAAGSRDGPQGNRIVAKPGIGRNARGMVTSTHLGERRCGWFRAGEVAPPRGRNSLMSLASLASLRRMAAGVAAAAVCLVGGIVMAPSAGAVDVPPGSLVSPDPVSYTHLDVYKRQVQEGLTNALKHGGPTSRCRVELDWGATQLRLELVTELDPGAAAAGLAAGGGVGLPSLADRARQAGGSMQHRLSGGAHLVSLRVPVAAAVAGAGCLAPVQ